MLSHAYRLAGNAKTASADYIPSLIAIDEQQISPAPLDIYFERADLSAAGVTLLGLSLTRWTTYDNAPASERDPIVGLATNAKNPLYIPLSELLDLAHESPDLDFRALVSQFVRGFRR